MVRRFVASISEVAEKVESELANLKHPTATEAQGDI